MISRITFTLYNLQDFSNRISESRNCLEIQLGKKKIGNISYQRRPGFTSERCNIEAVQYLIDGEGTVAHERSEVRT